MRAFDRWLLHRCELSRSPLAAFQRVACKRDGSPVHRTSTLYLRVEGVVSDLVSRNHCSVTRFRCTRAASIVANAHASLPGHGRTRAPQRLIELGTA